VAFSCSGTINTLTSSPLRILQGLCSADTNSNMSQPPFLTGRRSLYLPAQRTSAGNIQHGGGESNVPRPRPRPRQCTSVACNARLGSIQAEGGPPVPLASSLFLSCLGGRKARPKHRIPTRTSPDIDCIVADT
jgi:hypothetical protein